MDSHLLYNRNNVYFSLTCIWPRSMQHATRPTVIHWPTNINKIVELSKLNKNININLSGNIREKNDDEKIEPLSPRPTIRQSVIPVEPLSELRQTVRRNFSNHIRPITTDRFWNIIRQIRWYDSDDMLLSRADLQRYITTSDIRIILERMDSIFIPQLTRALSDVPLLDEIGQDNHNNILAHIIIKGLDFYNGIIDNPEVSLYLFDQYYPVYDWLQSSIQ